LLNLYKHAGGGEWLYRAQELANQAARASRDIASWDYNLYKELALRSESLYKGEVGVAVLAADLSKPELSCMPFFEREG
jgi:hypothetical protein